MKGVFPKVLQSINPGPALLCQLTHPLLAVACLMLLISYDNGNSSQQNFLIPENVHSNTDDLILNVVYVISFLCLHKLNIEQHRIYLLVQH